MKKKIAKVVLSLIFIILLYYLASILLTNNGQFVNHYFYPSSSINKSKEYLIFQKEIPDESIEIIGDEKFKKFVKKDLNLWIDTFKVRKSFGIFDLFPYSKIDDKKKILRISYKDDDKKFSTSYRESIWVDYDTKLLQSISTTAGRGYYVDSQAILRFYDDENRVKYLGELKIDIK